ncbi:exopolyphosphatase [Malassezia yamatoensis]|uniref:Exopolyphosphatase n=1 Tax=Malassezia yamatoensis TaxID=253288 RepID=A0AAJ6CK52_9BASI|nr:exopolyphosphatase [Malassezia yamatoensis]
MNNALSTFLRTGHNLPKQSSCRWVVGNEAGDLDSLACAIGYAYFSHVLSPQEPRWIPVLQTSRQDLALRPENLLVLHRCHIQPEDLFCVDDIPKLNAQSIVTLVDHNKATNLFADAKVERIIDHHMDEGVHNEAIERIIMRPDQAGSCSSILTTHFASRLSKDSVVPAALADLLLSALLIDTENFSETVGRAKEVDYAARAFLAARSNYVSSEAQRKYYQEISQAQRDISNLSIAHKLKRDYKQFDLPGQNNTVWHIGASSTVEPIKVLAEHGDLLLKELAAFANERQLDVLVVLAAFQDEQLKNHREVLIYSFDPNTQFASTLAATHSFQVDLVPLYLPGLDNMGKEQLCEVYTQRDPNVTRKQFAPALREVCAKLAK